MNKNLLPVLVFLFAVTVPGGALAAQDHSIVFSTSGSAATSGIAEIHDEELLVFTPLLSYEPDLFFSRLNWKAVCGDGNGNGKYDELPSDVDGIHLMDCETDRPVIYNFAFSLDTSMTFSSGDSVRDGDIFALLPDGRVWILFLEDEISAATGTSGIDVDGFTFTPAGDLIFSFDADEETTHEGLIAENNGETKIREGSILFLEGSTQTPHILYSEEDVLDMVNHAVGGSLSSIVDAQGFEYDPTHPGELLFIIGSSTSSVEGTVFSTYNGGTVAELNGTPLPGGFFGFTTEEVLSALTVTGAMKDPLRVEMDETISLGSGDTIEIKVVNGTPGGRVQVIGTCAVFPLTVPTPLSPPLQGTRHIFVDFNSPLFWLTASNGFYSIQLDGSGRGVFTYPTAYLAPDCTYIVQTIDHQSLEASDGAIMETVM